MHSKCLEAFSAISWLPAANTRRAIKSIGPPKKKKHVLHYAIYWNVAISISNKMRLWRRRFCTSKIRLVPCEGRETGRFDTRTQAVKLHKNFDHFKKSLQLNKKNILGEYSSFFKPSTWNYLQLDGINLYRNDFAAKRPVTERSQRHLKTKSLLWFRGYFNYYFLIFIRQLPYVCSRGVFNVNTCPKERFFDNFCAFFASKLSGAPWRRGEKRGDRAWWRKEGKSLLLHKKSH